MDHQESAPRDRPKPTDEQESYRKELADAYKKVHKQRDNLAAFFHIHSALSHTESANAAEYCA